MDQERRLSLDEVDAVERQLKEWEQSHPDASPAEFAEACIEALKEAQS